MPHLLKLFRNHFLDKAFDVNGIIVNKKCLERLLNVNCKDLKVAYKISQYHLNLQGTERQKVLPVTQLLSASIASALQWCGQKDYLENVEWMKATHVIKLLNDWFDIFNSKSMYGKHSGKNAAFIRSGDGYMHFPWKMNCNQSSSLTIGSSHV